MPQAVLAAPMLGCLNIHASLLPRWRGAAPVHRAILAGDRETGVCIIYMNEGLDTGPVLMRAVLPIGAEETTGELQDRLSQAGAGLIIEALARLDALPPVAQPEAGVCYAAKIDKAEARIDWTLPAGEVDRRIRGLSPSPGAWCDVAGERLKLLGSRVAAGRDGPEKWVAGQVLTGFVVACGDGAVEITLAQREGRRPMPAAEILRGLTLPPVLG